MIVSKVDGRVSGGGVGLAAASDLVIATEASVFRLPEALWGPLPCCVLPFLIRRVGFQRAYAMTLTAQVVSAARAHAFSLVDELTNEPDVVVRRTSFRVNFPVTDQEMVMDVPGLSEAYAAEDQPARARPGAPRSARNRLTGTLTCLWASSSPLWMNRRWCLLCVPGDPTTR